MKLCLVNIKYKRFSFNLFIFIALTLFSLSASALSLKQIIEKMIVPAAGRAREFGSFQTTSRLEEIGKYIAEPLAAYQRGGRLSIAANIGPDVVYREGISDKVAWEWQDPKPKHQVVGTPYLVLYRAARWPNPIRTIKMFQQEGHSVTFKNRVAFKNHSTINSRKYFVIALQQKNDELVRDYYLDAKTFLIVKHRDHRPLHPGVLPKTIETRYQEYENIQGVMVAKKSVEIDFALNKVLTVSELQQVTFNAVFGEKDFSL